MKVNGVKVTSAERLREIVSEHKPGDTLEIEYYRGSDAGPPRSSLVGNLPSPWSNSDQPAAPAHPARTPLGAGTVSPSVQ